MSEDDDLHETTQRQSTIPPESRKSVVPVSDTVMYEVYQSEHPPKAHVVIGKPPQTPPVAVKIELPEAPAEWPQERKYPFTKGINLVNEGVGYGEYVYEKALSLSDDKKTLVFVTMKSLRTRTGKVLLKETIRDRPTHR